MSKEENIIDFECPHCNENNSIKFTKKIKCKNCNKSIMGSIKTHTSSTSKLIFTALASVAVGAIAADKHISVDEMIILASSGLGTAVYMSRLKIETEYKIMKTCINQFESNVKTRDRCFCVVKKLNNYLNPLIVKIKGEDWVLGQIDIHYAKCKEPELLSNQTKS